VVVQGLWLPPHLAGAKSAPNTTDTLEKHGFHGPNAAAGLGWLKVAAHNKIYADRHSGRFQLYLYSGPYASKACFDVSRGRWLGANWCRVPALIDAMARFDARVYLYLDMDAFVNNFSLSPSAFLETTYLKMEYGCRASTARPLDSGATVFPFKNTHWGCTATTGTMVMINCNTSRSLLKKWWRGATRTGFGDQADFVRDIGKEAGIATLADDSFPSGFHRQLFALHHCGKCDFMPSLNTLLTASRVVNNINNATLATAVASLWEAREVVAFKL
jgi:hypothetical protein